MNYFILRLGCKIVNGAPACSSSYQNILQLADIFCVNESEAEIYTNNVLKIDSVESASQVLSLLLKQGCKTVIITLGPLGAVFASKDKPEPQLVPTPEIENPIDTTVSMNMINLNFVIVFVVYLFIIYIAGCWRCLFGNFGIFYCS